MSNHKIYFLFWLSLYALLFGNSLVAQTSMPADLNEAQKEIQENNLNYFKAFRSKDSVLFSSLYTFDCWIMIPGESVYCGPDGAREYFVNGSKISGIQNGKFITIQVYGISTDMIAETGFYQLFNIKQVPFDEGKYIVLWKKTGHTWKRFRESFNSSRNIK